MVSWWTVKGRAFLATGAITATAIVIAGWATGLRDVMHGALLSIAVVAFLPFVLVASALFLILTVTFTVGVVAALSGDAPADPGIADAGEAAVRGGAWFAPRYYRLLARQRHPVFWGLPAGVLLGGLLLWALIAAIVIPGEHRTVRALTDAQAHLERSFASTGRFPSDATGHLAMGATTATDGFGRPLVYEVSGVWKLASWRLTSLGFDGTPSADDLCVSGSTKWSAHVTRVLERIATKTASLDDRLAGIHALQCQRAPTR